MEDQSSLNQLLGEPLFSADEVETRVNQLARKIEEEVLPDTISIAPIANSSFPFAWDLLKRIRLPATWHTITSNPGGVGFLTPADELPEKILLIDVLIDSGDTMNRVGEFLLDETPVQEVAICTLLHKNKISPTELFVEYVGFACPKVPVVGYGLDFKGYFRDLLYISTLKEKTNV